MIEPRTRVGWSGYVADPELGFVPPPGSAIHEASEFTVRYDINELGMNDAPIGDSVERSRHRIMALGDSHTFAFDVSRHEAWPNLLEQELIADETDGTVCNMGVIGYGFGQYLLRMERTIESADAAFNPSLRRLGVLVRRPVRELRSLDRRSTARRALPPDRGPLQGRDYSFRTK